MDTWGTFLPLLEETNAKMAYLPTFDFTNTNAALAETDIRCAPLNETLMQRYLDYFVDIGFLPQPKLGQPSL